MKGVILLYLHLSYKAAGSITLCFKSCSFPWKFQKKWFKNSLKFVKCIFSFPWSLFRSRLTREEGLSSILGKNLNTNPTKSYQLEIDYY